MLVLSSVYPNAVQPTFGLFVRARMSRVARVLPLVVVAPTPWSPVDWLVRLRRPHYRPMPPAMEVQDGIEVHHPRFFCIPGLLKPLDGVFEAFSLWWFLHRLRQRFPFDLIDAHFVQPDGVAASVLARLLGVPYTVTLRGQLERIAGTGWLRSVCLRALAGATRIFSVSESLRQGAIAMGEHPERIQVVANGVDLSNFRPEDRAGCRSRLGLPAESRVLVSVGGLTERKGFHRVIELLPALRRTFPDLRLVIAGGANPEGNWEQRLRQQVRELGLEQAVMFLGPVAPGELRYVYSAGDLFVLATRIEGWANVFLEALACGVPVVTTRVGGNPEVIGSEEVGILVPFGDPPALQAAIAAGLGRKWDPARIVAYARSNAWEARIPVLVEALEAAAGAAAPAAITQRSGTAPS